MPNATSVVLCGKVYGNSNTYIHLGSPPAKPEVGALKVFAWSGRRDDPRSKPDVGELCVLVFDGKGWRRLKRTKSGITCEFRFRSAQERERRLSDLLVELLRLRNRVASKVRWGWVVAPYEPPVLSTPPTAAAPASSMRGRIKPFIRAGEAAQAVVSPLVPTAVSNPVRVEQSSPAAATAPVPNTTPNSRKRRSRYVDPRQLALL